MWWQSMLRCESTSSFLCRCSTRNSRGRTEVKVGGCSIFVNCSNPSWNYHPPTMSDMEGRGWLICKFVYKLLVPKMFMTYHMRQMFFGNCLTQLFWWGNILCATVARCVHEFCLYSARLDWINIAMGNLQTKCNNKKPLTISDIGAHWACDACKFVYKLPIQKMFMTYTMVQTFYQLLWWGNICATVVRHVDDFFVQCTIRRNKCCNGQSTNYVQQRKTSNDVRHGGALGVWLQICI